MFEIQNHYKVSSSLPIIVSNYKVLHFDEYPILFSGTNKFGNKLVGSFSYEDYDNDTFRYFVLVVDDEQYSRFFQGHASYRELMDTSNDIFVVDKDINDKVVAAFQISTKSIPSDYLPEYSSFIPEQKLSLPSLKFVFSLKGRLADLHKAIVKDIVTINQDITSYLENSFQTLNLFPLIPTVYSQPSQEGSYRLKFDIELSQGMQSSLFPIDHDQVGRFLNDYFDYVTNVLPNDRAEELLDSNEGSKFNKLQSSLVEVYNSANITPSKSLNFMLAENITASAEKLIKVTESLKYNRSFSAIETGKLNKLGEFYTTGYIDNSYKERVAHKIFHEEQQLSLQDNVSSDPSPKDYRILVYGLNRYSGKGRANLYFDDSEKYVSIGLTVHLNKKTLANSVFTKSMDEDKVVNIKGIATKVNGVYTRLECYL
jgi:hypothetical protein